jgi:hypothetical protein
MAATAQLRVVKLRHVAVVGTMILGSTIKSRPINTGAK